MQKTVTRAVLLAAVTAGLSCLLSAPSAAQAVKQRSEIDQKFKWDLSSVYKDDDAWQAGMDQLTAGLGDFAQYKGKLADSAANVRDVLRLRNKLNVIADNLQVYAHLRFDEDNRVSKYQEMDGKASDISSKLANVSAFIQPELLAMDSAKLLGFVDAEPGLKEFSFYLHDLVRTKAHILSDKEEALLAGAGPVFRAPSNIYGMIQNADMVFGPIKDENGKDLQITHERRSALLESPDRRMRRDADTLYQETYQKFANTIAATLNASVKKDYFLASTRKYNSCLEASLDENNIPVSVFTSLIAATNANLEPLHKWTALRKKMLGVDAIYPYDLYATLTKDKPREYSYDEAKATVMQGLSPLGKTYLEAFQKGLDGGWIDVYETQGKGSGAYSWGTYTSHPYVLMNYNGSLDSVSTLAHEMGHSINRQWSNAAQPYQYSDNSLFTAEVASTCNEAILMKYLIAHARTKGEKEYLLVKYIDQIVGTFYTQVLKSEFELAIHDRVEKGGSLSVDFLRKTWRDIYQKYWGPDLTVPPVYEIGGMRDDHFFRQYYVYQYATSYAAAQALSDRIVNKEPGAVENYYTFLKAGSADYPVEILKKAGVDMTTPDPVNRTLKLFAGLVDQLEQLENQKN